LVDILEQEYLNIFQAIAIYNTQDKDSAYQFIDGCNFSTLDNQLNLFIFFFSTHLAPVHDHSHKNTSQQLLYVNVNLLYQL
jgi:hypothetical protein